MNTVTLTWDKTEGTDGYLILRGGKQVGYSMTDSYVDPSANADEFNYFWVIPFVKQNGKTVKARSAIMCGHWEGRSDRFRR